MLGGLGGEAGDEGGEKGDGGMGGGETGGGASGEVGGEVGGCVGGEGRQRIGSDLMQIEPVRSHVHKRNEYGRLRSR